MITVHVTLTALPAEMPADELDRLVGGELRRFERFWRHHGGRSPLIGVTLRPYAWILFGGSDNC